jgi:hypothetical protein
VKDPGTYYAVGEFFRRESEYFSPDFPHPQEDGKLESWFRIEQFMGNWWVSDFIPLCGILFAYELSQVSRKFSGRRV